MKTPKIGDALTYFYIKRIKQWMECPVCHKRMLFFKDKESWVCAECDYTITEDDFLDDYVFWFCDGCNTYLNVQQGFNRKGTTWVCDRCGFNNDITFTNLKGECKDCGTLLDNPDATICPKCKMIRLQKAKAVLDAASDFCLTLSNAISEDNPDNLALTYKSEDDEELKTVDMKCANCGNTDSNTLWDEGDTFYCSICHHRTSTSSGKDDSVECPYCHRMRDRKAMYCRYCNDSTWQPSTPKEFVEIDSILKGMGY